MQLKFNSENLQTEPNHSSQCKLVCMYHLHVTSLKISKLGFHNPQDYDWTTTINELPEILR